MKCNQQEKDGIALLFPASFSQIELMLSFSMQLKTAFPIRGQVRNVTVVVVLGFFIRITPTRIYSNQTPLI